MTKKYFTDKPVHFSYQNRRVLSKGQANWDKIEKFYISCITFLRFIIGLVKMESFWSITGSFETSIENYRLFLHETNSKLCIDVCANDGAHGFCLRRLKLHGIQRQKVPKIHGLKKHQKNHSLACKKSSRFWNTKRTLM